ncbi:MAG: Hpt domain-containing protein [Planctomycetota bacterium]|jgi:HPt (histidine-containing phosphotransfer) domain-containing protein
MDRSSEAIEPLYSKLAEDPLLREIVDLFVEELPGRVSRLLAFLDTRDWEGLRRIAHQLKGAAGSHGFLSVTDSAAEVEQAIRLSEPEETVRRAVEALVDLCRRARPGGRISGS